MKTYRSKTTGLFVGRQADQVEDEEYEVVEVPTNPKEDLIQFLNDLQGEQRALAPPDRPTSPRPQPSEEEQVYAQFRADVAAGRVDLDETILAAPVEVCLRLMGLISERAREHIVKGKNNATTR